MPYNKTAATTQIEKIVKTRYPSTINNKLVRTFIHPVVITYEDFISYYKIFKGFGINCLITKSMLKENHFYIYTGIRKEPIIFTSAILKEEVDLDREITLKEISSKVHEILSKNPGVFTNIDGLTKFQEHPVIPILVQASEKFFSEHFVNFDWEEFIFLATQ